MNTRGPRSPQEFLEHASRLAAAGKERELLALADQFGDQFFGRFTPEERNRLEGIYETAQAIIDLENWPAAQDQTARVATEERTVGAGPALPVGGN
jgi:hypothetical protein